MAKEALAAFEATLKKEPHRLGATLSAAKAAEKAGDAQRTSIEELAHMASGCRKLLARSSARAQFP